MAEQLALADGDLATLLRLQRALGAGTDARLLLQRAQLLAKGGARNAAFADADAAWRADPSDPLTCLFLAGQSAPERAHELACDVIASPFAEPRLRQAALRLIDPARMPLALACLLPAALRVTLLNLPQGQLTLTGYDPERDFTEELGATGQCRAFDCLIERDRIALRHFDVGLMDQDAMHEVPPLPALSRIAAKADAASLWIVLPVKDGGPSLSACLGSLKAAIPEVPGLRLVVVDDGSTAAETMRALRSLSAEPGIEVLHNDRSLGFTAAVNRGLGQIGQGPVLLLNSDTWLPTGTLPRMLAHLADPTIGTVTPFTNNGGSLSVPQPRRGHQMPDPAMCQAIANEAARRNRGVAVDVLTGNGFAMLISAACLQAVGALSTHYDSGYYEEVDFCLRARMLGFRSVAAADCFVGHIGAVSYGAARQRLVSANLRRLEARFPGYQQDFMRMSLVDPLAPFRARLTLAASLEPLPDGGDTALRSTARLPANVLPIAGNSAAAEAAARVLAAPALAGGLALTPLADLTAAGLQLQASPGWIATPAAHGSLHVTGPDGQQVADLTAGPAAAELAGKVARLLQDSRRQDVGKQEVDGFSI